MTNRGPIHDLLPGWEPWKPEDRGDFTYGGCAGCGGDASGVDGDGLPACDPCRDRSFRGGLRRPSARR